jgi:threonine synthase
VFTEEISAHVDIPEQVNHLLLKQKLSEELGADFDGFKAYLLGNE